MGFPYGADEDAAYMVSWLELNKLNGVKLFAKTFKNFDNQYEGGINFEDITATTFDLKNIGYNKWRSQSNSNVTRFLRNVILIFSTCTFHIQFFNHIGIVSE